MARDPFANYDMWLQSGPGGPFDDGDGTYNVGECENDSTELGKEDELDIVETREVLNKKGKKVTAEYAFCSECAEYYSHDSSLEDLAFNVGDDSVIVDENGKYKGSRVKWVEHEPEDPRDDEDMGRYDRDDYDYV